MAARRLLIIMLVLLGISSVLAIALPKPERNDSTSQESGVTGETGATGTTGDTSEKDSDPSPVGVATESVELGAKKPVEIKAKPGSRMIIRVNSLQGSEVEVEGLGLAGFADRFAPAVFDVIFPTVPGKFRVLAPGERPSAVIVTG